MYNNTYIYFPNDKNEIIFYQNVVGNTIRNGLTIYSVPKKLQTKNNKSRFVHLSLQPNTFYRIIKRGMPKLYEYNLNPKNRSKSASLFNELLLNNLKQYYEAVRIPRINIKQIKIKSTIIFQISFDKEKNGCLNVDQISSAFLVGENENKLFQIAIDKALNDVDGNGDGKIIFEEFKQLMLNL